MRDEQWKDWSRRRWNNAIACFHNLGLSKVKIERTMCLNLRFGPWHGRSHWRSSGTYDCPLFQFLVERIARQRHGGGLPSDYGSEDFAKKLWQELPFSQYWGGIKNEVKLNRFFSFCGRSRELQVDEGVLLLTLL